MEFGLSLTPQAASHIKGQGKILRITVKSGGCSGLRYLFTFEEIAQEKDKVFECHGVQVMTDPLSFFFLEGSEVDYCQEIMASHFVVRNPRSTHGCGCGESFSLS